MIQIREETGRILVADDNRVNRMKLSISLEGQGYQVALAEDGQQALALLKEQAFDLLLLDIVMPGMDGFQVLEQVKADPELRDIPVIVISALDETDSAVRCIEMGAEDYLPKPFNPVLLRARLHASLQKKKLRDLEKAYLRQEMTLRQNEKLATLGKLSAGLAHELNNPAAAVQRSAARLQTVFKEINQSSVRVVEADLTKKQLEALLEWERRAQLSASKPAEPADDSGVAALTLSDRQAEIEAWLEDAGVSRSWDIAPSLTGILASPSDRQAFTAVFSADQLPAVAEWLHCSYTATLLITEIGMAAGRMSELVKALKSYTYLDQAPRLDVDIHQGLDDTLVILRSKLKQGVAVRREYAANLPRIQAYGSELNQVWTNLIDNAIDAILESGESSRTGEIFLSTHRDGDWVVVVIEDTGPGIPAEALPHLFDPFFTTKAVGKGSGLGLSISHNIIVQKHKGKIEVESQPGRTRFIVRLPINLER